jgi:hypothetical protein
VFIDYPLLYFHHICKRFLSFLHNGVFYYRFPPETTRRIMRRNHWKEPVEIPAPPAAGCVRAMWRVRGGTPGADLWLAQFK